MTFVNPIYFALISIPVFLIAAFTDAKTHKVDVRSFFFLKGLAYASFFANDKTIILALAVSVGMVLIQFFLNRFKFMPLGSGDYPMLHAYNLITMLFAPDFYVFAGFFIVPLIIFGVWNWLFNNRCFAPSLLVSLIVFFILVPQYF